MPEVVKSGAELIGEIDAADPAPGTGCFWWLGQNGFVYKGGGATVYVDPFLADHPRRATPAPVRASDISNADVIACSHDHTDHVDRASLPGAPYVPALVVGIEPRRDVAKEPIVSRCIPGELDVSVRIHERDKRLRCPGCCLVHPSGHGICRFPNAAICRIL